jgi:hypothetical protein
MIARGPRGGSNVASLEALEAVEVSRIAAQSPHANASPGLLTSTCERAFNAPLT